MTGEDERGVYGDGVAVLEKEVSRRSGVNQEHMTTTVLTRLTRVLLPVLQEAANASFVIVRRKGRR